MWCACVYVQFHEHQQELEQPAGDGEPAPLAGKVAAQSAAAGNAAKGQAVRILKSQSSIVACYSKYTWALTLRICTSMLERYRSRKRNLLTSSASSLSASSKLASPAPPSREADKENLGNSGAPFQFGAAQTDSSAAGQQHVAGVLEARRELAMPQVSERCSRVR